MVEGPETCTEPLHHCFASVPLPEPGRISGVADRDVARLGAGAARLELGEIGFAVGQPVEAGEAHSRRR